MKRLVMYWKYATRSLLRGGQRTLLAIFCVAVGVLAIVALQLVGNMVNNALTGNIREGNGGDIAVTSDITPFTSDQLPTFDQLTSQGTLTSYTAVVRQRADSKDALGQRQFYTLYAIDPTTFPQAGTPVFTDPSDGSFSSLLSGDTVVVTNALLTQLHAHKGDTVTVNLSNDGRTLTATIGGVIATAGFFDSAQMIVSRDTYAALPSSAGLPVSYNAIYANVPGHTDANEDTAKKAIGNALPLATVDTTKDRLQQNKDQVQFIRTFLQIVGLLALLIGGVGIINTMQVLLRRRRVEIAMLKTSGYRRSDLYVLFGLEAGLIGLLGGIVGAAAGIGVSFLVKTLVERFIVTQLPTSIDPVTVASGVAIGFFTALIFGLMPIVQASQIRPIGVLRELPEGNTLSSVILSIVLAGLLAVLFFFLAWSILQNLSVAIFSVGGAGIFLVLLSLAFALVVLLISKLPVLESLRWWYVLLVGGGVLVSLLLMQASTALGVLFLAVSLMGVVVLFLPRSWKTNVKLALRNIGRQRTRTVTTLVALYIGVFSIGLILILGQNIKDAINNALSTQVKYNSFILVGANDKSAVDSQLAQTSGIKGQVVNTVVTAAPVAVDNTPIAQFFPGGASADSGATATGKQETLAYLSAPTGYDLTSNSVPDVTIVKGQSDTTVGRNLTREDAGTNNVIMPQRASFAPLHLKLGSTIVLVGESKKPVTLTVVGFYNGVSFVGGGMYSDNSVNNTLSSGKEFYVYSLILDPKQATQKLNEVQQAVPSAQTLTVVDFLIFITDFLNNLIVMLTAIASLAMLAGIIIIANAVALAMLERRRELGILKAVGHTSRSVLGEVLIENGIVGFTGGFLAMLLVALATTLLSKLLFKTDFGVSTPIVLTIVLATAAVCMLVAGSVAYQSTRVRPLEVLRYE
ncbi:MAG: ABC transporter permease [Ktedonobacterales bacterium]